MSHFMNDVIFGVPPKEWPFLVVFNAIPGNLFFLFQMSVLDRLKAQLLLVWARFRQDSS
jgi:hypothetical protein